MIVCGANNDVEVASRQVSMDDFSDYDFDSVAQKTRINIFTFSDVIVKLDAIIRDKCHQLEITELEKKIKSWYHFASCATNLWKSTKEIVWKVYIPCEFTIF